MFFPFTFNFSIPGMLNPFRASSSAPAGAHQKNKTQSRIHQSPTNIGNYRTDSESSSQAPSYLGSLPSHPSSSLTTSLPVPVPLGVTSRRSSRSQLPKIPRRLSTSLSPTPSTARALPLSRKRRWEPAFGEESIQSLQGATKSSSTTSLTFTSTSGYLDTPAKYRDMMDDITMNDDAYRDSQSRQDEDDAPPLKKRRGLAGSIVSTAVSAALIGSAVGLTVYRLWRDRGKDGQIMDVPASSQSSADEEDRDSLPPPPYDAGAWRPAAQVPAIPISPSSKAKSLAPTPAATPKAGGKSSKKPLPGSSKRPVGASTRNRARVSRHAAPSIAVGSPRTRPEFDFGKPELKEDVGGAPRTEVEDQMDWIGDKLTMLIEQGKRALQTEVVVMSEAKEDEVDDGRGDWEEDPEDDDRRSIRSFSTRSRSGSVRKARSSRPKNIIVPSSSSGVGLGLYNTQTSGCSSLTSLSASPKRSAYAAPTATTSYASASAGFVPSSAPSPFYTPLTSAGTGGHIRGLSYESALPSNPSSSPAFGSFGSTEDPAGWESPELKESMERARARLLARRNGGV